MTSAGKIRERGRGREGGRERETQTKRVGVNCG